MDKMDVERDEDNVFFPSSSTSASNPSSCAAPSARRSSSNGAEGYAALSEAALSDRGAEEVESGRRGFVTLTVLAEPTGDNVNSRKVVYSLLLRWGETASPAKVEAEPPEPSELTKERLSPQERRGSAAAPCVGVGGRSGGGPCSRLLDLINFFSFRGPVLQHQGLDLAEQVTTLLLQVPLQLAQQLHDTQTGSHTCIEVGLQPGVLQLGLVQLALELLVIRRQHLVVREEMTTAVLAHQGLVLHGLAFVQRRQPLVVSQQLLLNAPQLLAFPYGVVPFALRPRLLLLQLSILGHEGSALRRGGLPLQGEDLSLLTVRLALQLPQLGLHRLALGLQGRILERRREEQFLGGLLAFTQPFAHRLARVPGRSGTQRRPLLLLPLLQGLVAQLHLWGQRDLFRDDSNSDSSILNLLQRGEKKFSPNCGNITLLIFYHIHVKKVLGGDSTHLLSGVSCSARSALSWFRTLISNSWASVSSSLYLCCVFSFSLTSS
ncbi:hypothetical protein EYF80_018541 [Liparis tanakae]|uniref:Uncharacterized protein n=1 Tax=Liparis tanakae TaxID=230148 RepID=A0A4Z2I1T0_9TELE|nr:hypothetical protein EYF80_018541 [Liparis tanakae]